MSRLFRATEASLNRTVVIKVLPPELTSEVSAARFKQEMEFAARLQHPHILPVLAAGAPGDLLYYVMPWVSGESLRHRLEREGQLPVADALRLLTEVADALAFAHDQGIIHRDIKPANILLEGRHAVLADFGIARAILEASTGSRLTGTGSSVGTPGYMAPEQLAGDVVDARADVYALAVVGYEMLAGKPPFAGPTAQAVMAAHLTEPPRPLVELRPEVPKALSDAISRALSKSPGDRFLTAGQFAAALPQAGSGEQPAAHPSARRRAYGAAAGLVLALVALAGWRWVGSRAETNELLAHLGIAADSSRFDDAAAILAGAGAMLADSRFEPVVPRLAGYLLVASVPPGAKVHLVRVSPVESFATHPVQAVGTTPMPLRAVVAGEYLVRLITPGRDTLAFPVTLALGDTIRLARQLPPADSALAGMVVVDGGPGPGFLAGRYEITNAEYARFVAAGAYRDTVLWPAVITVDGRVRGREAILARLVDRTGLPGPRGWNGGKFPDGKADHPVTGVSWYEAAAYARWASGTLPTAAQWWRLALADTKQPFPWGGDGATIDQRANFGLAGTTAVGSHPLGISPWGAHDIAGNVREWLLDAPPGSEQHVVVGGAWQDPSYMFEHSHAELFDPGFANDLIGFRIVKPLPSGSR